MLEKYKQMWNSLPFLIKQIIVMNTVFLPTVAINGVYMNIYSILLMLTGLTIYGTYVFYNIWPSIKINFYETQKK